MEFEVNKQVILGTFLAILGLFMPLSAFTAEHDTTPTGWGDIILTHPGEPYISLDIDMDNDGDPEYTEVNILGSALSEIQNKCCTPKKLDSIDCNSYMQVLMDRRRGGDIQPLYIRIQYTIPGSDRTVTCQGTELPPFNAEYLPSY